VIARLNALGDRMLGYVLPATVASADVCPGHFRGCYGSCCYWCHCPTHAGCHSYRWCSCGCNRCVHECNNCC